jgi:dipeptidyl aminopeptidase/acylaminoacyl peptidase
VAGLPPFERYYAVRRFGPTLAFTPDGESVLFVANISGQFNLWRVPVSGGWPEQLTAYTDHTVRSIAVSRDGLIAFAADGDGDEYHRVYLLEPGGWPSELAGGDQVQHTLVGSAFSPDGSRIVFAANARTPSASEIWVQELAGGEPRPVFGEDMYAVPAAWSPDGSRVLAIEFRTNSDFSIHLVDAADGTSEELTPHDDPVKFEPGPWDADGSGFYLLTDSGSEFVGLARFDLEARSWSYLAQPDGDVEAVAASVDGRVLAWIENDRGWSKVRVRDLSTGEDLPEAQLPPGASHPFGPVLAVSPDGSRVAVLWDEARRGQNVYVVETATGESCRITDSSMGLVPTASLVEPELVSYPTWDGREVPAWLFRAAGDRPAPVVLYVHGGPESQERAGYKGFAQYLCSRGISVFATNIRGSTGYGKTYQRMIYRDWGNGDLRDWEAAASWLGAQSWVDGDRIGVLGGSYGGFAVLSCVSRLPDLFAAGVDIFGPSNLVSLIKSAPPTWWRGLRQLIGDAEEDEEALLAGSPLTYADQIRAPLLVIQGAKDPRVVQAESDQLVERLRELGTPVEYEIFEDEGHGFTRYTNEVRAWRLAVEFLERHLVEAGPAPKAGARPSAPAT